jgi:O-antigen ligase
LLVWRDSIQLLRAHPLAGIGPGTFTGEFRRIQSIELSRKFPDRYHEDTHNLVLGIAIAQGTPGILVLLALTCCGLACGLRGIQRGSRSAATQLAAFVAMMIALQFTPLTAPIWLYLVALIVLLVSTSQDAIRQKSFSWPRIAGKIVARCTAVMALAFAGLAAIQDGAVASTGRWAALGDLDRVRVRYTLSEGLFLPSDDLWCSEQLAAMARRSASQQRDSALALAMRASARGTK